MYELRVKLRYFGDKDVELDRRKRDLLELAIKAGHIASYAVSSNPADYQIVEIENESNAAAGSLEER